MRVEITLIDRLLANLFGGMRYAVNRLSGVGDQQMGKQNAIDIDARGMLAELVFARAFNLYPDFSVASRSGGADFDTPFGSVDVKATDRVDGNLLVSIKKTPADADWYVLAVVTDQAVEFVGCASAYKILSRDRIRDLGHGETFFMPAAELDPINELKELRWRRASFG